ncbi:MAG: U32 family peptidase [Gammaproteobacteria bacterium]|nr:U32 family peptidase [Gammaproteobacteria bacterium]
MKLAAGPILAFWERKQVFEFYAALAAAPVDIVYLGETVCAKRRALAPEDWLALGRELRAAGKQVVLSTLALVEAESELAALGRIANNGEFPVEANSMAAVSLLAERAPFVIGPHINVYNDHSLAILAAAGATRWVPPLELDRDTFADIRARRPADLQIEMFAFGRMPLAFSARCFTARAHDLGKDECGLRCADYPEGMLLETREGEPFLVINGIQTQSARSLCLLGETAALAENGVEVLRLSPQAEGFVEVVAAFRAVLDGTTSAAIALECLAPLMPTGACDGYWRGAPGMERGAPVAPSS